MRDPFKGHRFPREVTLLAVRWYCPFPLSFSGCRRLAGGARDRGGPGYGLPVGLEVRPRDCQTRLRPPRLARAELAGRRDLCPRWRQVAIPLAGRGPEDRFIDFGLTARRDAKATKAFLKQATEGVRLYQPVLICMDKAPGYRKVIRDLNHRYDPHFNSITHVDRKWRNNRIESDHAALKRLFGSRQSFRSLRSAKATLMAVEAIRTIKNGHVSNEVPGVPGEIDFVRNLFGEAA